MTDHEPRTVPAFIGRTGPSLYHRLNPLTKLTLAIATSVAAVVLGGVVGPVALVALLVVVPAALAGSVRPLLRAILVLTLPIGISVFLVNLLFFPGGSTVLLQIGPIAATAEGLGFAIEILARLLAIAGGITLFYLTTAPGDLTLDLERRGVSSRFAFVANSSVQTVPAMVERAQAITAAQRARGLDTEGSVVARIRGIVPIVGPVILGSIGEVEQRTMALEARAFARPGRRTLLWAPADSSRQRAARWLIVAGLVALIVARVANVLPS